MKTVFFLPSEWRAAHKVIAGELRNHLKKRVEGGEELAVAVSAATRSDCANAKYHAMIAEISAQIGGDLANREDAKRILISAFRIDTIKLLADEWAKFGDLRMGRGLRGEVVLLGAQSRHFSSKLAHAFIEWLHAFGAEAGVVFREPFVDPETGEIHYLAVNGGRHENPMA